MPFNLLFVATQFGSFNVIYPVLNACSDKYNIGYIGIKDITIDNLIHNKIITEDEAVDYNCLDKYDMFITGTSPSSDIDYNIWEYARKRNKKSMCILDMSKDYEVRFKKNNRYLFPDIICVMSEGDRDVFCGLDTGRSRIVMTGSPYLSNIYRFLISKDEKNAIKKNMLAIEKKVITFCTEYIAKRNEKEKYGYDEISVLNDIACYIEKRNNYNFKLFIKLHPNDSASLYEDFLKRINGKIDYELIISDPEYKILQISDVVVGMTSVILTESSILGLNVVSYQPVDDMSKIYDRNEAIKENLVTSKDELVKKIDMILNNEKIENADIRKNISNNAVEKIIALIEESLPIRKNKPLTLPSPLRGEE